MRIPSDQPTAYQKGYIEFYKLKFKLTPDVLIPRPETELLVDEVLSRIKNHAMPAGRQESRIKEKSNNPQFIIQNSKFIILDIGTGAGNIAISIAKNLRGSNVKIVATDVSPKALKVAKQNAKLHGVGRKIVFIKSDLLKNPLILNTYPSSLIIVTNLPYIPHGRIAYLDSSVKDFEPLVALDGGSDGFELYRKLFKEIKEKGWKPKLIIGEIDYTHSELALLEARKYFPDYKVEVKKDLAHKPRILILRLL